MNDKREHQVNNSNNHVGINQFNQEHISVYRLIAKDVKFDLLRCQVFNRDHCVNLLVTDISKTSACENHIVL